MPGLMVHLLTARKFNPAATTAFLVGNIAPDSVSGWKEKDRSHFRDRSDRLDALRHLAQTVDMHSDFSMGVVLHLFLDYYWDIGPKDSFVEAYKDGNWFQPYRHELALSSAWLYHHTDWSREVWERIANYPQDKYDDVHELVKEDIHDLIQRNKIWHEENQIGPSCVFTPEMIETITSKVASDFSDWLGQLK